MAFTALAMTIVALREIAMVASGAVDAQSRRNQHWAAAAVDARLATDAAHLMRLLSVCFPSALAYWYGWPCLDWKRGTVGPARRSPEPRWWSRCCWRRLHLGAVCACAAIPLIFHPVEIGSLELSLLELGILELPSDWIPMSLRHMQGPLESSHDSLALAANYAGRNAARNDAFARVDAICDSSSRGIAIVALGDRRTADCVRVGAVAISRDGRAPLGLAIAIPAAFVAITAIWQLINASSNFSVDEVHRSPRPICIPRFGALPGACALLVLIPAIVARGRRQWLLMGLAIPIAAGIGVTFRAVHCWVLPPAAR
ncbi:MAG: hypothetical protein QM692_05040 [Thermomicrobiales bacterium]